MELRGASRDLTPTRSLRKRRCSGSRSSLSPRHDTPTGLIGDVSDDTEQYVSGRELGTRLTCSSGCVPRAGLYTTFHSPTVADSPPSHLAVHGRHRFERPKCYYITSLRGREPERQTWCRTISKERNAACHRRMARTLKAALGTLLSLEISHRDKLFSSFHLLEGIDISI